MEEKRLAKFLANSGVASRRKCEEIIFEGRVRVNGKKILLPQTLVDGTERIEVDGKPVSGEEKKVYFILNKPRGYLCSPTSNARAKLALDLFGDIKERLFTVGRLDRDTTGLLIVTNDGHFANRVIHPSSNVNKEYVAKTSQELTAEHLKAITQGTEVEGTYVKPLSVKKIRRGTVKIVVSEGKKREVRLLLANAGLDVKELKRTRIGGLQLGKLPLGAWRTMTESEKKQIFES